MIQVLLDSLITTSLIYISSLGFKIIYSPTKFINFSHGILFTLSAYLCHFYSVKINLAFAISAFLALAFTSFVGVLFEKTIYLTLRKRSSSSLICLIASLGIYIIVQNIISLLFGDQRQKLSFWEVSEGLNIGGGHLAIIHLVIIFTGLIIYLTSIILNGTRFIKIYQAISADWELSFVSGINIDQSIAILFSIGSVLSGISGILFALDVGLVPTMGMNPLMLAIVAVLIGGRWGSTGLLIGSFIISLGMQLGAWYIGSQWQETIALIILFIFMLATPLVNEGLKTTNGRGVMVE